MPGIYVIIGIMSTICCELPAFSFAAPVAPTLMAGLEPAICSRTFMQRFQAC
jgi:hypothetical protein